MHLLKPNHFSFIQFSLLLFLSTMFFACSGVAMQEKESNVLQLKVKNRGQVEMDDFDLKIISFKVLEVEAGNYSDESFLIYLYDEKMRKYAFKGEDHYTLTFMLSEGEEKEGRLHLEGENPGDTKPTQWMLDDMEKYINYRLITFSDLEEARKNPEKVYNLSLYRQKLTALPEDIRTFKNLETLRIFENRFSKIPEQIKDLANLKVLDLKNNQITQIPDWLWSLDQLTFLDLSRNPIEEIPAGIENLTSLEEFYLTHTKLKELPAGITQIRSLEKILITDNQIKALPDGVSNWTSMKSLHFGNLGLRGNQFSKVPPEIAQLQALEELGLGNTRISSIPESILKLPNLKRIYIGKNFRKTTIEQYKELNENVIFIGKAR